jgi:hypothetical protein
MIVARIAGTEKLEEIKSFGKLEKAHDAGLGVSITWLCD